MKKILLALIFSLGMSLHAQEVSFTAGLNNTEFTIMIMIILKQMV